MAIKTYLVVPDLHVPFHDIQYLKIIAKVIEQVKPHGLIQLGDALDFFQISKYLSDPSRKTDIVDDILTYKEILGEWEALLPQATTILQLEGNHESRLTRYIWANARDIHKAVRSVPEMLGFKGKLKWFPLSDWKACRIGDCVLHHGHFFNQHVGVGNLTRYPTKLITGHTHRFQYVTNGERFSVTLGHGSNEEDTAHSPTPTGWQQAFALLHEIRGVTYLEPVLVVGGKAVLRGVVIS